MPTTTTQIKEALEELTRRGVPVSTQRPQETEEGYLTRLRCHLRESTTDKGEQPTKTPETPETDAEMFHATPEHGAHAVNVPAVMLVVSADFARSLERQRDEARRLHERDCMALDAEISAANKQVADLTRQLTEAKYEMFSAKSKASAWDMVAAVVPDKPGTDRPYAQVVVDEIATLRRQSAALQERNTQLEGAISSALTEIDNVWGNSMCAPAARKMTMDAAITSLRIALRSTATT